MEWANGGKWSVVSGLGAHKYLTRVRRRADSAGGLLGRLTPDASQLVTVAKVVLLRGHILLVSGIKTFDLFKSYFLQKTFINYCRQSTGSERVGGGQGE